MCGIMSVADIVICRAGAITVSELIQLEKPAILVPLQIKGVGQYYNAKILSEKDGALIYKNDIEQKTKDFIERLQELNKNLPLRVEVLIIKEYPAAVRNMQTKAEEGRPMPKIDQRIFFDLWYNKLLLSSYSSKTIRTIIGKPTVKPVQNVMPYNP